MGQSSMQKATKFLQQERKKWAGNQAEAISVCLVFNAQILEKQISRSLNFQKSRCLEIRMFRHVIFSSNLNSAQIRRGKSGPAIRLRQRAISVCLEMRRNLNFGKSRLLEIKICRSVILKRSYILNSAKLRRRKSGPAIRLRTILVLLAMHRFWTSRIS